ncbi:cell division protein [Mycobacterium tuberculosis]|nr:cell division protein [Mycobacterium tuberculosis]
MVADAREEAIRIATAAKREYEASVSRAQAECDRLIENGNISYEKAVQEGIKEQQRLVSQNEVVAAANAESTRLVDTAHAEADRLRGECDIYVDNKLAEFEEFLNGTLRSVGRGRHQLRTAAGTHDYAVR